MDRKTLSDFFRQFSRLLASGERLEDALVKCGKLSYMKVHSGFVDLLKKTLGEGKNFGPALLDAGFPPDYIGYFNRGEWEGALDRRMAELADALERDAEKSPTLDMATGGSKADDDAEVKKLVESWLVECAENNASDLHVIPVKGYDAVVRLRVNGVMRKLCDVPHDLLLKATVRIKHMACLDIAEKRLPQDGRILIRVGEKDYDLRVSVVPVYLGEKITIRFLCKTDVVIGLDRIMLDASELEAVRKMAEKPYGLILVTGKSGSGKTTTCYSMLYDYIERGCNVVTLERPFEYLLNGATQIALDPSIGLDYPAALRAALRTDPDVIFVGEFQNAEIIRLAVMAAQTGHVVMGQFHSPGVAELVEMLTGIEGVEPSMLANILNGAIAQALLRKLCGCKKKSAKKGEFVSVGCDKCLNSGYKGRVPVYEIVNFDHDMKEAIARGDTAKLRGLLKAPLEERAIALVKKGVTSRDEAARVFGRI